MGRSGSLRREPPLLSLLAPAVAGEALEDFHA